MYQHKTIPSEQLSGAFAQAVKEERQSPSLSSAELTQNPAELEPISTSPISAVLSIAKKEGVVFSERVADGRLVADGLDNLAPADFEELERRWSEVERQLLPNDNSCPSSALLNAFAVDLVYVTTEQQAAFEVSRICGSVRTIAIDLETAPRSEFLPPVHPIALTKYGRRSKVRATLDTSAALDPFRAEVRLLQVAVEINHRLVVLVIGWQPVHDAEASASAC
jgi:hypothetical protein